jgi:hypothetical protein
VTASYYLLKALNELVDTADELDALGLPDNAVNDLKELVGSTRWRFLETISLFWVRGKHLFIFSLPSIVRGKGS